MNKGKILIQIQPAITAGICDRRNGVRVKLHGHHEADIQTTIGYYCWCAHLAECRTRIPFVRPPGLLDFDMDLPRRTFLHLAK
jgi:hypothetical protein